MLEGPTADGYGWGYFRWKSGALEPLTYSQPYSEMIATDINDNGVVVGWFRPDTSWVYDAENETQAGLVWEADSSEARKVSAPVAASSWDFRRPGTIRQASLTAINNQNDLFSDVRTGGGYGFLFHPFSVFNAYRNSTPLSDATASLTGDPSDFFTAFTLSGTSDTVARAASGHYIGRKQTITGAFIDLQGTVSGMADGEAVSFDPIDLNDRGVVVGTTPDGAAMVIHTLAVVPLLPEADILLPGMGPVAINNHVRAGAAPAVPPGATPAPAGTPMPAPQILGWDGNATVLWERQDDGTTWHAFGLEEMIPSMDGWEIWNIADMNDDGTIVGTGGFKDPTNQQAQVEQHGFMLVPINMTLRATGTLTPPPENEMYEDAKKTTGTDALGPLPMGAGRPDFKGLAYTAPVEVTAKVRNMPNLHWRWERFVVTKSWWIRKNVDATAWRVSFRSQYGLPSRPTYDATIRSAFDDTPSATENIYAYDSSAMVPADFGPLAVGDYVYEKKQFSYQVTYDAGGRWHVVGELPVGQRIIAKRTSDSGIVASDFEGVENSNEVRFLDMQVTEADIRGIVGGVLPIEIEADANN